jgi:hypothetical protein
MRQVGLRVVVAIFGIALACTSAGPVEAQQVRDHRAGAQPQVRDHRACAGAHQLKVLDLDMTPDPAHPGQPVQHWIVTVRSDQNGECTTFFAVQDGDQVVGRGSETRVPPGQSKIVVPAVPNYRFEGRDHCFVVTANIANTPTRIDSARRICATLRPVQAQAWTLK